MTDFNAVNLERLAIAAEQIATAISDIAALMAAPAAVKGTGVQPEGEEDWVQWPGTGSCPLNPRRGYQRRYRDGMVGEWTTEEHAGAGQWVHTGNAADIVAYRVAK